MDHWQADVEDLVGREQIRQAMARYARGCDRRDELLVRSAYHEDSVDDHGWGFGGTGWEAAAAVNHYPTEWKMQTHFLGQDLIEIEGDRATSEFYFESHQIFDDPDGLEWDWMVGGRYLDRWERREGEFKIAARVLVYDWMRTVPIHTRWPGPDHEVPKYFHEGQPVAADAIAVTKLGVCGPADPSYEVMRTPPGR